MSEIYKEIPAWGWLLIVIFGGFLITALFAFVAKVVNRFIEKNDEYWEKTNLRLDKVDDRVNEGFDKVNENLNQLITENRVQGYRVAHLEREMSHITGRPIVNYP